jgi:iron(III) transport system ATP-binding protein
VTAVKIEKVGRAFGSVRAVDGVSLDIASGEFFTLLGPSGCGKTTLLRMIAGFCELDRGAIRFDGRRIDTLPPHRRNTGMVFQNYAIFPNLTVAANVAYGLRARKVARGEMAIRVERALELVQLTGFGGRWPHQLSGGQLQRVALARCLVIEPDVLLLDEPLSNLDAQLRVDMRREIRQLQQALKITTVYVTHDQEEALAISDRVAVMRGGRLEQVAAPAELYRRPATAFVAGFVGATNLLTGRVLRAADGSLRIRAGGMEFVAVSESAGLAGAVALSLRPETIRLLDLNEPTPAGSVVFEATLAAVEFLGALTRMDVRLPDGTTTLRIASIDVPPDGFAAGLPLRLAYDPRRVSVFPT